MNFITTTDLRTKSSGLVTSLKKGLSVSLIHRSAIVGKIIPADNAVTKTIKGEGLKNKIQQLAFPKLSAGEIDKRYGAAMTEKHGKSLH